MIRHSVESDDAELIAFRIGQDTPWGAFVEVFTFGCTQFDKFDDDLGDGRLMLFERCSGPIDPAVNVEVHSVLR